MESITPKLIGVQIRALLLSLRDPNHKGGTGWQSYATDDLRREALDYAGICWLAPGEMAPGCCCDWSLEKPEGPRLRLLERLEEANFMDVETACLDTTDQ